MLRAAIGKDTSFVDMDSPAVSTAAPSGDTPNVGLRRRLIGAGLVGLVGSLLPSLASRAGASPDTTPVSSPQRPTDADVVLLGLAQRIELAAVSLYDTALSGSAVTDDVRPTFEYIRQSHLAYSQALSALLGKGAPGLALDSLLDEAQEAFAGSSLADVATAAAALENAAAATHTELVGALQGTDGAELVASILIIESRHAAVLTAIAGETALDALLLNEASPLAAEKG
ncbi:MAG: Ferritin-like domain [Actinomycetota bacterium]|jgi:hypothetical protein